MATYQGTNGSDTRFGTDAADSFYLLGGNDVAYGYSGNDLAWGDGGNDWFRADGGNDSFVGGLGADTFYGGAGSDTTFYHTNTGGVSIYLDRGYSWDGSAWDYQYDVEHASGSGWNDTIFGNAGANGLDGAGGSDYLAGFDGNDTLYGGDQGDTLVGGNGNDWLVSGYGYDTLYGGTGADRFDYDRDIDTYWDTLADFNRSEGDKIDLTGIDAASSYSGNQAFTWVGYINESTGQGQLGYYQDWANGKTYIHGNVNADVQREVFIEVNGSINLNALDFYL